MKKSERREKRLVQRCAAPWQAALLFSRCELRKACKNLREVIQAAEDRYLEVYACERGEFTKAGGMKGWCGHPNGGRKLHGKKVGSAQCIREEDGKLLR